MRLLPPHDRQRLSTLALSMARIERGLSAQLPTPLTRRLLAQAAEQHALQQPKQYERWDQPFFVEHAWLNTASSLLTLAAGAASLIPLIEMIPMQAYLLCVPVCVCFLCLLCLPLLPLPAGCPPSCSSLRQLQAAWCACCRHMTASA